MQTKWNGTVVIGRRHFSAVRVAWLNQRWQIMDCADIQGLGLEGKIVAAGLPNAGDSAYELLLRDMFPRMIFELYIDPTLSQLIRLVGVEAATRGALTFDHMPEPFDWSRVLDDLNCGVR